jgi:tetratricopeptide (TPR) repeat protein
VTGSITVLNQEDIDQQQKLLEAHRRTLGHSLEQYNALGVLSPSALVHSIREAWTIIAQIKASLRVQGVSIIDEPEDEPHELHITIPNVITSDSDLTQHPRDFTVQIRQVPNDASTIVGTGVIVSIEGQIVTCAHVVRAAGLDPRNADKTTSIGVYLPQVSDTTAKARQAQIVGYFPQHDDDVVLLQLIDGPLPLAREQVAVLASARQSTGNTFRSYGYLALGPYPAGYAEGTILGLVEPPADRSLQADPLQLRIRDILPGLSGAGVLDLKRDRVVGLITERWYPGGIPMENNVGWGVDIHVLTFPPFGLFLDDATQKKRVAPQPRTDVQAAREAVASNPGLSLVGAPSPLPEWVGRTELQRDISSDWSDAGKRVTGLIGFGGEGKSSLARHWLDSLIADSNLAKPKGVFWWSFYDKPSTDEFFEAALIFMSGGQLDVRKLPSASIRAQVIGAMLGAGHYLFVIDGLELMQHQEGDAYGLLRSGDLRAFLELFAAPQHQSFCLITSRAPVLDLLAYPSYMQRDVDRLSATDGRDLLRKLGVKGHDNELNRVVATWDGHALTLSLLATYLRDKHKGDIGHISDIPPPTADEPRYERVHRVLRRYDQYLSDVERAFLMMFSAFRRPVTDRTLLQIFQVKIEASVLSAPIFALDHAGFESMLKRLFSYRILQYDPHTNHYSAHPLVRAHYLARLTAAGQIEMQAAHERIKDYYLKIATRKLSFPALDELEPLIESVHHACRAGAYDEGYSVYQKRIEQGTRWVLTNQLAAYETELALLLEFFPGGDSSQEPLVSATHNKRFILNDMAYCLICLGRLREALPLLERAANDYTSEDSQTKTSIIYENLTALYVHLGMLALAMSAAQQALPRAQSTGRISSLAWQGWIFHLQGDIDRASETFRQAEMLERSRPKNHKYLYSLRGIQYSDHLRRIGNEIHSRAVAEANLVVCERNRWTYLVSLSHRVLGDLDANYDSDADAREHYDEAIKIARSITRRDVLIEALHARGRWSARTGNIRSARGDLEEALEYARTSGYRMYEIDIHLGLAWMHIMANNSAEATAEAEYAYQMSIDMG